MIKKVLIVFGFLVSIFIGITLFVYNLPSNLQRQSQKQSIVEVLGHKIEIEVMRSTSDRTRGLSGRESLAEDKGMLFVFSTPGQHSFWMKDMKFSIDIIWILDDEVVDIWKSASVPMGNNTPSYRPKRSANYVLEVAAGFVEEKGINIGNKIRVDINE